jgi:hypothetical protein
LLIRAGSRVLFLNAPEGFETSLGPVPEGVDVLHTLGGRFDVVHLFVRSRADLERDAATALKSVRPGGVLWISYPKRSSNVETDLTRDIGWELITAAGWEAVTQVAVDDVWSALRFRPASEVGSRRR